MVWPCDMRDDEEDIRAAAAVLWGKVKLHPSELHSPASPLAALVTPICDEGVKALKQSCLGWTVGPRCLLLDYSRL